MSKIHWDRVTLKEKAKKVLKKDYWSCFIIGLILAFVSSEGSGGYTYNSNSTSSEYIYNPTFNSESFIDLFPDRILEGLMIDLGMGFIVTMSIVAFAIGIFVGNPLKVSGKKFFLDTIVKEEFELNNIKYAFQNAYKNIVSTIFWTNLYILLWSILLIIPGIIKGYAYSMVPYLLAENPNMDRHKAISISERITSGHKMDMFVIDLSFLGWYILGGLLFGLGGYFVNPYVHMTKAHLYLVLKKAI